MSWTLHRNRVYHVRRDTEEICRQTGRRIVSDEADLQSVVGLLEDDHARVILESTSVEPHSKSDLADELDVSLPTVSRRIEGLENTGLIQEQTRLRSDGHHDSVYVAKLDRFEVRLRDGKLEYDLERMERDMSDELERLWSKF